MQLQRKQVNEALAGPHWNVEAGQHCLCSQPRRPPSRPKRKLCLQLGPGGLQPACLPASPSSPTPFSLAPLPPSLGPSLIHLWPSSFCIFSSVWYRNVTRERENTGTALFCTDTQRLPQSLDERRPTWRPRCREDLAAVELAPGGDGAGPPQSRLAARLHLEHPGPGDFRELPRLGADSKGNYSPEGRVPRPRQQQKSWSYRATSGEAPAPYPCHGCSLWCRGDHRKHSM